MRWPLVGGLAVLFSACPMVEGDEVLPTPAGACLAIADHIDFGQLTSNSPVTRFIELANRSERTVDVTVTEAPPPFSVSERGVVSIAPKASVTLNVIFAPPDARQHFGRFSFTGGRGCETTEVTLTGRGEGQLSTDVTSLDFGTVAPGESATVPLVLTNSRRVPLTIFVDGILSISAPLDLEIPAAGALTVPVTFSPRLGDRLEGTLLVKGIIKGPDGGVQRFSDQLVLRVSGLVGAPVVVVDQRSLELEHLPMSQSVTRTVTVRNVGSAPSRLFATIENERGSSFPIRAVDVQLSPGALLQTAGVATLTLTLLAERPAVTTGTVVVHSDDPNDPLVPITFVARGEEVAPCPTALDVSERDRVWTPAAYPAQLTFTFNNPHGVDCLVDDIHAPGWGLLTPQRDQLVVPAFSSATRTLVVPGPGAGTLYWKTFGVSGGQSTSVVTAP